MNTEVLESISYLNLVSLISKIKNLWKASHADASPARSLLRKSKALMLNDATAINWSQILKLFFEFSFELTFLKFLCLG